MFWNRKKSTPGPNDRVVEQKAPTANFTLEPTSDITIYELIEILQHYRPRGGSSLPSGYTEMQVGVLPTHLMRHFKHYA